MLSDAEQRRLAQIEAGLRADDPSFARRFDRRPTPSRRRRVIAGSVLIVSLAVLVVAALGGVLLVILIAVVGLVASGAVWVATG